MQRKLEPPEPRSSTTTLTIPNVDARLKERLRLRAVRHGRSMEAELRDTLRRMLANEGTRETNLAEAVRRHIAPLGGVELEPHPPVPVGGPPTFDR